MAQFDLHFDSPVTAVNSVEAFVRAPVQSSGATAAQVSLLESIESRLVEFRAASEQQWEILKSSTTEIAALIAMSVLQSDDQLISERVNGMIRSAVESFDVEFSGLQLTIGSEDLALLDGADLQGLVIVEDSGLPRGDFRIGTCGRGLASSLQHQISIVVERLNSGGAE